MTRDQQARTWSTSEIIIAFARYGVPITTLARALVIPDTQVTRVCERAIVRGGMRLMPPQHSDDRKSAIVAELVHLREALDDARQVIREYREKDAGKINFRGFAKLTADQAAMVSFLVDRGRASRQALYDSVYGYRPNVEQPDPKIIDVQMCKIRPKLVWLGVEIKTIWGFGFAISDEHRAKLTRAATRPEDDPRRQCIPLAPDAPSIVPTEGES